MSRIRSRSPFQPLGGALPRREAGTPTLVSSETRQSPPATACPRLPRSAPRTVRWVGSALGQAPARACSRGRSLPREERRPRLLLVPGVAGKAGGQPSRGSGGHWRCADLDCREAPPARPPHRPAAPRPRGSAPRRRPGRFRPRRGRRHLGLLATQTATKTADTAEAVFRGEPTAIPARRSPGVPETDRPLRVPCRHTGSRHLVLQSPPFPGPAADVTRAARADKGGASALWRQRRKSAGSFDPTRILLPGLRGGGALT